MNRIHNLNEEILWLFSGPVFDYLPWIALAAIIHFMSRIPRDIRWQHEYELPEEFSRIRKGPLPAITIFALAIGTGWLAWETVPAAVQACNYMIREGMFLNYLTSSPWPIAGLSLIMAEVYLGIALRQGFLQVAQAEIPKVPKWLLDIGIILFVIFTILLELATLPATWPAIIIVFLASIIFILFAGWTLWASFPNTPMRRFFCTVLVPHHHSPFVLYWNLFWGCLKWVWKAAVYVWEKSYEILKKIIKEVPKKVYRTIYVKKPVTRLVRKLVPVIPSWVPSWARKAGSYVLKWVDTLVEVVMYVIVAVVVVVIIIVSVVVWVVVIVVVLVTAVVLTLVCAIWGLILVGVAVLTLFLWWIPMWILRLFFFN